MLEQFCGECLICANFSICLKGCGESGFRKMDKFEIDDIITSGWHYKLSRALTNGEINRMKLALEEK